MTDKPFVAGRMAHTLLTALLLVLTACATPYVQAPLHNHTEPVLTREIATMDDGFLLPYRKWQAKDMPHSIVLGVHGLNDYSNSFKSTGQFLSRRNITTVAYDQRGFGETDGHGLWHGSARMIEDLKNMIDLLLQQYPGVPLYLLGESMGGAVVLALPDESLRKVAGVILVAPAVWSRDSMPWFQRLALWIAVHTFPEKALTGEGLEINPSDNIEMLRELGRDPLVIKATRVDVLYGVSNLMDLAVKSSRSGGTRTLILYGRKDDIIPREPTCRWLQSLPAHTPPQRIFMLYDQGFHMLTRDLQAEKVLKDLAAWVISKKSFNPHDWQEALVNFCVPESDS